jgi:hypothetical protein
LGFIVLNVLFLSLWESTLHLYTTPTVDLLNPTYSDDECTSIFPTSKSNNDTIAEIYRSLRSTHLSDDDVDTDIHNQSIVHNGPDSGELDFDENYYKTHYLNFSTKCSKTQ